MSFFQSQSSYSFSSSGKDGKTTKVFKAAMNDGDEHYSVGLEQEKKSDGTKREKFFRRKHANQERELTQGVSHDENPWNIKEEKNSQKRQYTEDYETYGQHFTKFENNTINNDDLKALGYGKIEPNTKKIKF